MCTHKHTPIFLAGESSKARLSETRDCRNRLCRTVKPAQVSRGRQDIRGLLYDGRDLLPPPGRELLVHRTKVRSDLSRETGIFTLLTRQELECREMGEGMHGARSIVRESHGLPFSPFPFTTYIYIEKVRETDTVRTLVYIVYGGDRSGGKHSSTLDK